MNIGFDAKRLFLNNTGLGNYSRDLVAGLIEQFPNEEYHLFTPKQRDEEKTKFITNHPTTKVHTPQFLNALFPSYWRSISLENDLVNHKIDVFHGLSNEIPQRSFKSKLKYIVTIHDLIFLHLPHLYQPIDRTIYNKKFYYAAKNSDRIIATSQHTKQDIIEKYGINEQKIEVVYQSCHNNFKERKSSEEIKLTKKKYQLPSNYILSVGTIEERKNLALVIKALKHIDLPLVAIGKKTSYYKTLQGILQKEGITDKVIFLENVSFSDLPAIYQGTEVFVYPSIYEGFGIPVLEALYSKIPVITSNASSLPEVAGEHSICINPTNLEELIDALSNVLSKSDLRKTMIEQGYLHAQKFQNNLQAKQVYDIYQQL
jgi:glycosyltransferase involved in cell wall biosynthesis